MNLRQMIRKAITEDHADSARAAAEHLRFVKKFNAVDVYTMFKYVAGELDMDSYTRAEHEALMQLADGSDSQWPRR